MQAFRAEWKGDFDRALQHLDHAGDVAPLSASDRVYRADLLLKAQRTREAHAAFAALRQEFKPVDDPDIRYLRHYCTHQLSMLSRSSSQWSYEAKQARFIDCSPNLRRRFPMVTVDETHEAVQPRR
jgi:hypothetical protein